MPTLYALNALASVHNQMDETAPTSETASGVGWNVGANTAPNFHLYVALTKPSRGSAGWTTTQLPNAGIKTTTSGDCFRSTNTYTGTILSGTWTFDFVVTDTAAYAHNGRVNIRAWRSANADGSSATEITSGIQVGSIAGPLTTSLFTSQVTFNPGAVVLSSEYLFIQAAWEITTAGSMIQADAKFRYGSDGIKLVTPAFGSAQAASIPPVNPSRRARRVLQTHF